MDSQVVLKGWIQKKKSKDRKRSEEALHKNRNTETWRRKPEDGGEQRRKERL